MKEYICAMKKFYADDFRLGILGGGQLGRMFIQAAVNYDVHISILDPSPNAPCAPYAHEFVTGDFASFDDVYRFGKGKDVVTIEIEHVNVEALEKLQQEGVKVYPDPKILRVVKDKGLQKQFYAQHQIPTAPFYLVDSKQEIERFASDFPLMQKMRTGGYDGKGVQALRHASDIETAFEVPSVLEKMVDFQKEIAILIARNESGETKTFPVVEMEFNAEANLVEFLFSPANIDATIEAQAESIAKKLVAALDFVGLLAIEFFVTQTGEVLVNEIAPRPHNSGHHTIEACRTSQYEQHLRAILNLPLGDTSLVQPGVMINLLGEQGFAGNVHYENLEEAMATSGVYVHLYGKAETKPFRKMGHITVVNLQLEEAKEIARKMQKMVRVISSS
jgi:5-(carboxyamino)imidazole ribonucleotide synthase